MSSLLTRVVNWRKPKENHINKTSDSAKLVEDFLQVVEVSNASPFIAPLFQRRFGSVAPDVPRHFVALYSDDTIKWQSIGYVHFYPHGNDYLCGGLVMDNHLYRRVLTVHRKQITEIGGIAEHLLRESFTFLGNYEVIWGYVGDKQAEKVDLRVGFEHTEHEYIMAIWKTHFSDKVKQRKVKEIIALGPF